MMLAAAAVLGLMSSLHCLAMCGPLVLLVCGRADEGARRTLAHWGVYHAGRVMTYAALGAMAGGVGRLASTIGIGSALAVTGGIVLLAAAAASLAVPRASTVAAPLMPVVAALTRAGRQLAIRSPRLGLFAIGLANGLLPCGMVYAALMLAASAGTPAHAAGVMTAFGVATAPALIAVSLAGGLVPTRLRGRLRTALPAAIAATGVLLVVRGLSGACH